MKHLFARTGPAMLILLWLSGPLDGQLHPDWENPELFQRGQVEPHATLMPFESVGEALENRRKNSAFHYSLNGQWKFHWAENPDEAPGGFQEDPGMTSAWQEISVPSNWQMEGYGFPIFRNIGLPFDNEPPDVPEGFNPVGSYFRTFDLPAGWEERQVFLHFEGVQSCSYVWINGKEAGYNQGGMEPAEYDITPYLQDGTNTIAVRVLRFCDGTFMEDQDTWRLSGIYRDVYLMSTPRVHIRDFYITTDLDRDYRDATLHVEAELANYFKRRVKGVSVRMTLYDSRNRQVRGGTGTVKADEIRAGEVQTVTRSFTLSDPDKWSAEHPFLYTLVMELVNEGGEVLEVIGSRVGFREVEVRDQAILINGVAVKFNGVNSHMMHPETGHAMDTGTMRTDLHLMKLFNINCVRTSHYPPNVEYLDMADELGIYVVDETGDEAHAYTQISRDPLWRDQYLDRMRKMVYRDRNHPSVVIWSAGNESGPGNNLCALMKEGKRIDPSRPAWMYGGNGDRDPKTNPIRCEDIVGPRYLEPFKLELRFGRSDDPRPSFMDEYIAATGNSLGGLGEYWELIHRYRRLTGGAIWDWISPGITHPVKITEDDSPHALHCALMNRARLVPGKWGSALYLSGHDDWLEVYRDGALDISGESLTLSFCVRPEPWNGHGYYLTKGDYQYGIVQAAEDRMEFYVHAGDRVGVEGNLPDNWVGEWHHVAGIYDGKKLELYIDGKIAGTRKCTGPILNGPYPVNIGKSSEIRDSHMGQLCHATIDRVRIFDRVVPVSDLIGEEGSGSNALRLKRDSRLWLDFESVEEQGTFYSVGIPGRTYGLIWPDRSVQPELWQLKKTPQPVTFRAVDLEKGELEIENRHHFTNLDELDFHWMVTADGRPVDNGSLDLNLAPGDKAIHRIPFEKPVLSPSLEYHLLISCRTSRDHQWSEAGHEVAWEQFTLPWHAAAAKPGKEAGADKGTVLMKEKDDLFLISGEGFSYTLGKESGTLESMIVGGKELIRKGPALNLWRAPLANDLDSWAIWHVDPCHTREGMGREIANGWRSIGLDRMNGVVTGISGNMEEGMARVEVETSLYAGNHTTGFKVHYSYAVAGDGTIGMTTRVSPRGKMTRWLPKVGLQMELDSTFHRLKWFGRGPFETYPDRKTGARFGLHYSTAEAEVVPYIIPQDYGNKTDVSWIEVTDREGSGLLIRGDTLFNTSAHIFTTDNLDRALYRFQLKRADGVILNLDHRVTGVGGTANSTLNPYRVLPDEYRFSFFLKPVQQNR